MATGRRGSPLLRRCKREGYTHGLRPPQMEALRAMCGALIPSLPVEGLHVQPQPGRGKDDLDRFFRASAADGAIPDEVSYYGTIYIVRFLYTRELHITRDCIYI
jgi:long-chain-alcohol oxidase